MNRQEKIALYNHLLSLSYWKYDKGMVMPLKDFLSEWQKYRTGKPMAFDIGKINMVNGFITYDGENVFRFEAAAPKVKYSAIADYYEGRILARAEMYGI